MVMTVNILYIIQFLRYGGTEKQLVQLIRGLKGSCFRPHLCTLETSAGFLEELPIPKINLQCFHFHHLSMFSKAARLSAFIHDNDIQLVQTFFQDPFLLGAILKYFNKFKLVGSFRDMGFWRTRGAVLKMRVAYPFYDGFIANSKAVRDFFVRGDRLCPKKVEVIYNGVDVKEETVTPKDGPPLVGIVANCNRLVKRCHDFIHAAAIVHRHWPETRFILVGDGPLRRELEKLGNSLGLGDAIRFTGHLADPLELIRSFTVGVITSQSEGFCNAILEYMACGVPVVATAAGGNPELVQEGKNGFLVPVGDIEKIAEKIEQLLRDQSLRCGMQQANRNKATNEFSISKMVEKHELFYDRILSTLPKRLS